MCKLPFLAAFLLTIPALASAQLLGAKLQDSVPTSQTAPQQQLEVPASTQAEASAQPQEETSPQLPPAEITPEQKIYARREIQKNIKTSVVNANKAEREKMLDAVETLQKIKNRRENLKKAPDEQIPYEAPQINASSRQGVQKYLQDTFVAPLDDSFKTQEQEQ